MTDFKEKYSFEKRKTEADRVVTKYPQRVPIIFDCKDKTIQLDKVKFLVPRDITPQELLLVVKKRLILGKEDALYMFINNVIPPMVSTMGELYDRYKEECGFLYISINKEKAFGGDFNGH